MALKYPRLALSHTVKGSCVVQVTTYGQLTIPEGVYWTDYVHGGVESIGTDLHGRFTSLLDALAVGTDTQFFYNNTVGKWGLMMASTDPITLEFGHANTTEEMRRMAKRLGFNPLRTTDPMDGSVTDHAGLIEGHWDCPRAEFSKLQEDQDKGNAASSEAYSGNVYGFRLGDNLKRYLLRFQSVPEAYVYARGQVQGGVDVGGYPYDLSFESRVYQYLRRGEMVRLYTDAAATATYTTGAMTKTSTSVVVASGTGLSIGGTIWVDGEEMWIEGKVGTTLTVVRANPETHPAGAPVSKDFVATYVLDTDGGNVNMQEFAPARRAHNQTRYDLDIALRRTRWTG